VDPKSGPNLVKLVLKDFTQHNNHFTNSFKLQMLHYLWNQLLTTNLAKFGIPIGDIQIMLTFAYLHVSLEMRGLTWGLICLGQQHRSPLALIYNTHITCQFNNLGILLNSKKMDNQPSEVWQYDFGYMTNAIEIFVSIHEIKRIHLISRTNRSSTNIFIKHILETKAGQELELTNRIPKNRNKYEKR
jgi:hypothetical protein